MIWSSPNDLPWAIGRMIGWYSAPSGSSSFDRAVMKAGIPSPIKDTSTAGVFGLVLYPPANFTRSAICLLQSSWRI